MTGETPGGGGVVAAEVHIAASEAPKAVITPAEIRSQEVGRMSAAKKQADELKAKGLDFNNVGKKEAQEVVAELNKKGAALPVNEKVEIQVQEALDLQKEITLATLDIKSRMVQAGESTADEAAIAAKAEVQVLENRIKAATPPEVKLTAEQQKERDDIKARADEKEKVLAGITKATEKWVEGAGEDNQVAEMARALLMKLAAEEQANLAKSNVKDAAENYKGARDRDEQDTLEVKLNRTKKILKVANEQLKKTTDEFKNPNAPIENQLLANNMDSAVKIMQQKEMGAEIVKLQKAIEAASEDKKPALQLELEHVETIQKTLATEIQKLTDERLKLGTPEQQEVNYISGVVKVLTKEMSLTDDQIVQIDKDPLGLLDKLMSDESQMNIILTNSGMSPKQQKDLIATAHAETAMKSVKRAETADSAMTFGRQFLSILSLIFYTAGVINKNKKGGQ